MKLIIVESPTKAKTITKFLGKGFVVKSSFGHVRDLPKSDMGIDIEKSFKPHYVIPDKARPKVTELKQYATKADEIILASDEDREGEAIAWHLVEALGLDKKNKKPYSRIVFHEITKTAIEKALANPREIDLHLVDAQQARRVLDRLVGYELSPFLWKKIRRGLSAGRVQSVALRLIVEREREIQNFAAEEFWTINTKLKKANSDELDASLIEQNGNKIEQTVTLKLFTGDYKTKKSIIADKQTADAIAEELKTAKCTVASVEEKETLRNPSAPFTTSTLQQAAISSFGFSAKQTMMSAQKLYEQGYITYMRTDSLNLSLESLMSAKKIIEKEFGKEYSLESPRYFKNKSKSAQEAHEAIRPTNPEVTPEQLASLEPSQAKLYRLIWNRMIACQMQSARLSSVKADITAQGQTNQYLLRANGSTVIFDGFLRVYASRAAGAENFLPPLAKGDELSVTDVLAQQKFTQAPPRYNEATLVKVLEEHEIGRPSTYAPTISTIIERKYVDKNEEKRLFPLEIGFPVNDLLVEHFPEIVGIDFTATIEKSFDEIADGEKEWVPVIRDFYEPFHKRLEEKTETVKKDDLVEKIGRACPDCGGDLIMKFGRFGKFIACSNYPTCKYTEKTEAEKKEDEQNAGIICDKCGSPMVVKRGRFGAFLGCSNYPECKNIMRIEQKTGLKCPKCGQGDVVARKSKKGKMFYGCNRYPDCDFVMWNKPTGELCPDCGQPLALGAKGKIVCSSKECKFSKDQE